MENQTEKGEEGGGGGSSGPASPLRRMFRRIRAAPVPRATALRFSFIAIILPVVLVISHMAIVQYLSPFFLLFRPDKDG